MKKIFKVCSIAIVFILLISACDKTSLLDIQDPNSFTTRNFWKTPQDLEQGLTAVYNYFYKEGTFTRNIYTQMYGMADTGTSNAGWIELQEWAKFEYTNYDFAEVGPKIWHQMYTAIFRANQVLAHVNDVTFSNKQKKKRIIGQAKFLRGLYYFYLEVLWENIPLVLKPSSPGDAPKQRTPKEVWAQIEKDFSDAANDLPAQWDADNIGRATKGATLAFLGEAYMQQHKWKKAKKALYWLVQGDGKKYYGLMQNYDANFTLAHENNKESVFEIQFSMKYPTGYDTDFSSTSELGTQHAMNASPKGLGWNNIQARRWLVKYYKREKTVDGKYDPRLFYNLWYNDRAKDFPDMPTDLKLIYGRHWQPSWGKQVFIRKYSKNLPGKKPNIFGME